MSVPTGLILPPLADPPYPFLTPFDPRSGNSSANVVANTVYLERLPRVSHPVSITAIEYFCVSAAGNVDLGLYTTTDPVGTQAEALAATFTRVAQTGATAAAGTNAWHRISLTAPYTYNPASNLWVSFGSDGAPSVARIAPLHQLLNVAQGLLITDSSVYSSGLPASFQAEGGSTIGIILRAILA